MFLVGEEEIKARLVNGKKGERGILIRIFGALGEAENWWRMKTNINMMNTINFQNTIHYIKLLRIRWVCHIIIINKQREKKV